MHSSKFVVQCVMEDLLLAPAVPLEAAFRATGATIDQATGEEVLTAGGSADLTVEPAERKAARVRAMAHVPSLCTRMGNAWTEAEALPFLLRCVAEDDVALSLSVAGIVAPLGHSTKFRQAPFSVHQQCRVIAELFASASTAVREETLQHVIPRVFGAAADGEAAAVGGPCELRASDGSVTSTFAPLAHTSELLDLARGLASSQWPTQRASGALLLSTIASQAFHWLATRPSPDAPQSEQHIEVVQEATRIFRMNFLTITNRSGEHERSAQVRVAPNLDPLSLAAVLRALPLLVDVSALCTAPGGPGRGGGGSRLCCADHMLLFEDAADVVQSCVAGGVGGGMDRQRRKSAAERVFSNECIVAEHVLRSLISCTLELVRVAATGMLTLRAWGAVRQHSADQRAQQQSGAAAAGRSLLLLLPPAVGEAVLLVVQEQLLRPLLLRAASAIEDGERGSSDWQFRWLIAASLAPLSEALLQLTAEVIQQHHENDSTRRAAPTAPAALHHLNYFLNFFLKQVVAALCADPEEEVRIAAHEGMGRLFTPLTHNSATCANQRRTSSSGRRPAAAGTSNAWRALSASRFTTFLLSTLMQTESSADAALAERGLTTDSRLATMGDGLLAAHCSSARTPASPATLVEDIARFMLDTAQVGVMDPSERVRAVQAVSMAGAARCVGAWKQGLQRTEAGAAGPTIIGHNTGTSSEPTDPASPSLESALVRLAGAEEQLLSIVSDLLHDDSYLVQLDAISVLADFIDAFGAEVVGEKLVALTERLLRNPLWRIRATLAIVLPSLVVEYLRLVVASTDGGGPQTKHTAATAKRFIAEKLVPLFIHVMLDQVQAVRDVALSNLQERILTIDPSVAQPFLNDLLWPALVGSSLSTRTYIMRIAVVNAAVYLADPPNIDVLLGPPPQSQPKWEAAAGVAVVGHISVESPAGGAGAGPRPERARSPSPTLSHDGRGEGAGAAGGAVPVASRHAAASRLMTWLSTGEAGGQNHLHSHRHKALSTRAAHVTALDLNRHVLPLLEGAAADRIANVRMRSARGLWQLLCPGKELLGFSAMRIDPISSSRSEGYTAPRLAAARREGAEKTRLTKQQRDSVVLPLLRRMLDDEDRDVREIAAAAISHCT